jgi:hypothetical protein
MPRSLLTSPIASPMPRLPHLGSPASLRSGLLKTCATKGGADDIDPRRRRRRRRVWYRTRQASRGNRDRNGKCRKSPLCARPRRRPGDRFIIRRLLRRSVGSAMWCSIPSAAMSAPIGAETRRKIGVDRAGARGGLSRARRRRDLRPNALRDRAHLERNWLSLRRARSDRRRSPATNPPMPRRPSDQRRASPGNWENSL